MNDAGDIGLLPHVSATQEHAWIVAVGASAGGLEPLERFFASIQGPTHAAFVVIQHLAPDHRSMMAELLGRHAHLPVHEAVAGESLQPDHIYLMPPGILMTIEHEHLVFAPRPLHGVSLPIDAFLRSLAGGDNAPRCIGVILSGSGSDGSSGAVALRAAGGFVMAQTPETARFDSMPRSLIAATSADAVMPPEGLAAQVLALTRGQADRLVHGQMVSAAMLKPSMQRLFDALVRHCGVDFSHYKLPTLTRRIERRMAVLATPSIGAYADAVDASEEEREALRRELLIPVTGFFRDPAAFAALGVALKSLLASRSPDRPLRIWSAGCATGEEAYSVAIAALEACAAASCWPGVKVFGTDLDPRFLAIGGAGSYPIGAADGIAEHRLAQWFNRSDDHISVKPELRQAVLFARHNLLEDAPFTHMDLIVCRNTLIYFESRAQERVMRRLQYALNAEGVLFLGGSESLGALQADFQALDAGHKIYRLVRPVLTALAVRDGFGRSMMGMRQHAKSAPAASASPTQPLVDVALARLIQAYAPLSLLVNAERQLIHAWGPTKRYLRLPEGEARLDAIRLLPPDIGPVASHALLCALRERQEHRSPPLRTMLEGEACSVRVVARPLVADDATQTCVLLSIEEDAIVSAGSEAPLSDIELDRLAALEHELVQARANLQTGVEELEAANEELQATNEELMSSNEELQSTNEELQSVNEELYTVNAEYNAKLDVVSALNADLDGMSQATGIATVFVNHQLELVRFTPEAADIFRLRVSDIGRPLAHFSNPLNYPELLSDLQAALAGGPPVEREVRGAGGGLHIARTVGYGEEPGRTRRAVVSLVDVSRLRDIQRLQAVIDSVPANIAVLDVHGTIRQVNHAWTAFARDNGAGSDASVSIGANYLSVLAHDPSAESLEVLRGLQGVLSGRLPHFRVTYPCTTSDRQQWFVMHATGLQGLERGAVIAHVDITPWNDALDTTLAAR